MQDLDRELAEVLKYLPGWKLDPSYRHHTWCSGLIDGAGHGLHFNAVRTKGRLYIGGRFKDEYRPDRCEHITVARNRPPEKIAADIQRRLLPWYLEAYAEQEERIKSAEINRNRRARVEKELKELLGGDTGVVLYVDHDGEHVSIDIRWVGLDVAKDVLKRIQPGREINSGGNTMRQETTPTFERVETGQPFAPPYDYSAPACRHYSNGLATCLLVSVR